MPSILVPVVDHQGFYRKMLPAPHFQHRTQSRSAGTATVVLSSGERKVASFPQLLAFWLPSVGYTGSAFQGVNPVDFMHPHTFDLVYGASGIAVSEEG